MTDKSDDMVGHLNAILARGGGNLNDPIVKSSPNIKEVKRKQRSYGAQMPTYKLEIFLHMNLSYELIKHVKKNSCLSQVHCQRYLWYDPYHC